MSACVQSHTWHPYESQEHDSSLQLIFRFCGNLKFSAKLSQHTLFKFLISYSKFLVLDPYIQVFELFSSQELLSCASMMDSGHVTSLIPLKIQIIDLIWEDLSCPLSGNIWKKMLFSPHEMFYPNSDYLYHQYLPLVIHTGIKKKRRNVISGWQIHLSCGME